ncbi:MAG: FeoB-associated Cys-rich membrane protein [Ruminococcaceae bacterium]|nr:FeoB-associated Cys-rich membrane protein [Oscillospiraceae bacterium]
MPEYLPTVIVAGIVAALFIAVTAKMIIDKKKGKSSCSCGGNCGACGLCSYKDSSKD